MAHLVDPYNLDDDDDALFMAALHHGHIWIDDDDAVVMAGLHRGHLGIDDDEDAESDESENRNVSELTHSYSLDEVLQVAHAFIQNGNQDWVNFSRVVQHLSGQFHNLKEKCLKQSNKKYSSLLKFFEDYPSMFEFRQDRKKQGLYWVRLKRDRSVSDKRCF